MAFSDCVLRLAVELPADPEGYLVRRQLCRAATSIGANVEEADGALSRRDARHCFGVARKEARETRYWLRLIVRRWNPGAPFEAALQESQELLFIVSAIARKLSPRS